MINKKLVYIFFTLLIMSCSKNRISNDTNEIIIKDIVHEDDNNDPDSIIIYLEGSVEHYYKNSWHEAEIGNIVRASDSIKTSRDGYCEIQFAGKSILKILESSNIDIEELSIKDENIKLESKLKEGSILAKLKKLTQLEKFRVKTDQVVAGVRGTEFYVSVSPEINKTIVSVNDGAVAVYPNIKEIIEFEDVIFNSNDNISQEELVELLPVINKNESMTISNSEIENIEPEMVESYRKVTEIIQNEENGDKVKVVIEDIKKNITPFKELKENLNESDKEFFKQNKTSEIIENIKTNKDLYKTQVTVYPKDANIFVDDKFIASGGFSKIFDTDKIKIKVTADGFITSELDLNLTQESNKKVYIELEENEKENEKINVNLSIEPANFKIKINNKTFTNNTFTIDAAESYNFTISVEGYEDYNNSFNATKNIDLGKIELQRKLVLKKENISDTSFVNKVTTINKNWILADKKGIIFSITSNGFINWKYDTRNRQNQNSFPINYDNKIFFSGSSNASIINSTNGKLINNIKLTSENSHLFGRTMYPISTGILFPENNSLKLKDLNTFKDIISIDISNGSTSSPIELNNKWYLVDSVGKLNIISSATEEITNELQTNIQQMIANSPVVVNDSSILLADRKGNVELIDINTQTTLWYKDYSSYGGETYRNPIIDRSGNKTFILNKSGILCINNTDGSLNYILEGSKALPLLFKDKVLWINGDILHISDLITGKEITKLEIISTSVQPSIIDNNLLISGDNGQIEILSLERIME